MRTQDARRAAREFKMDLVEVDARVRPPVCKLLEAGKAAYQAAQREKVRPYIAQSLRLCAADMFSSGRVNTEARLCMNFSMTLRQNCMQEHKKKLQELQRKQAIKEVRFSPATAENDIQVPALLHFHHFLPSRHLSCWLVLRSHPTGGAHCPLA